MSMPPGSKLLAAHSLWTLGSYGGAQLVRLGSNIVLAALLSPGLFGVMALVNSVSFGAELMTDAGTGQSIITHGKGECPRFYNTAWTINVARGLVITLAVMVLSPAIASFFEMPLLASALPVAALALAVNGTRSTSLALLRRRFQYKRQGAFELFSSIVTAIVLITLAWLHQTIWALVIGGVVASLLISIASHFLLPAVRNRLVFDRTYAVAMFRFGKWIFLASLVYYLSTQFDRLFFGKTIAIDMLGLYVIAKTLANLIKLAAMRLSNNLVLPLVSTLSHGGRRELRDRLSGVRLALMAASGLGTALIASSSDLIVGVLYDERYAQTAWILSLLMLGSWFAVASSFAQSILVGLRKPGYAVVANAIQLAVLVIGVPLAMGSDGFPGAVLAISLSELAKYVVFTLGSLREGVSYVLQDVMGTALLVGLLVFAAHVRGELGLTLEAFEPLARIFGSAP